MKVGEVGDYLRQKHAYLFRESGTPGVSNAVTKEAPSPNKAGMSLEEKCQFIRTHGEQAFLNLLDNAVTAKPLTERPRSSWTAEEKAGFVRRFGSKAYFEIPA